MISNLWIGYVSVALSLHIFAIKELNVATDATLLATSSM